MSRSPRTTKKQKEQLTNFLENNRILLGGKVNPSHLSKILKIWEELAAKLNGIGPPKNIKQWKDVLSEMKTATRRRARDVRYDHTGTGGGAPVKPLTDLEERLLNLISSVTVEGADLMEAGVSAASSARTAPEVVTSQEEMVDVQARDITVPQLEVTDNAPSGIELPQDEPSSDDSEGIVLPAPPPLPPRRTTRNGSTRPRRRVNVVHAAIEQHDMNLKDLALSNYAIARALGNLGKAIEKLAGTLEQRFE